MGLLTDTLTETAGFCRFCQPPIIAPG